MARTALGIWYAEGSDPVDPVWWTRQLAESFDLGTDYDTGWQTIHISLATAVRRIGNTVWLRAAGSPTVADGQALEYSAGIIPAQFRPAADVWFPGTMNFRPVSGRATPAGNLDVFNQTGATRNSVRIHTSWVLG